jgi:hypothetical protein
MWDDFSIGTTESGIDGSAVSVGHSSNLSVSKLSYWYMNDSGRFGGRIGFDSPEGQKLKSLIEAKKFKEAEDYAFYVGMKSVDHDRFLKVISEIRVAALEEGERMKADEIKRALGLFD